MNNEREIRDFGYQQITTIIVRCVAHFIVRAILEQDVTVYHEPVKALSLSFSNAIILNFYSNPKLETQN